MGRYSLVLGGLLGLAACGRPGWHALSEEEFNRYGDMMKSDLRGYVEAQEAYFADAQRYAPWGRLDGYAAQHAEVVVVPHTAAEARRTDGFSMIAYHDSVPQMICAVYGGSGSPPSQDGAEPSVPTCRREARILVCEAGHAYPATAAFSFCPMHGGELVEEQVH